MSERYDKVRSSVLASGSDSRVEVNQRALIDKILARYASAGAVYRELIQNSNDAEASTAEVLLTTTDSSKGRHVTQVVYRNDGLPFRSQDWNRMRKIAEGNPDESKVGAFGVGAYTMFSICEEPLIISGGRAMAFSWKGDALWVKVGDAPNKSDKWTSFVLPSRDLYPIPNIVEFGQFLCTSLTFTNCLTNVIVYIDGVKHLTISKRTVGEPRVMTPPRSSSWWSRDGAVTASPKGIFSLGSADGSITETTIEMSVEIDGEKAHTQAGYVSAKATVNVPSDMERRMQRVTKKKPPREVNIQIFIDADDVANQRKSRRGRAQAIVGSFSPSMGAGRVFIGFKTSQTTGLGAHLAAPLIPTVEREAIDFQDRVLRVYNSELLFVAGILMRLTLEHSMNLIGTKWKGEAEDRLRFEENQKSIDGRVVPSSEHPEPASESSQTADPEQEISASSRFFSFARFMSSGVKKIAEVITSGDNAGDEYGDLLKPRDTRPLSTSERYAIVLMRSFSPTQSTPETLVGRVIAEGFENCLRHLSPPVLTKTGVTRGSESRLPHHGIEGFVSTNVVRSVVLKNAESYLSNVAGCNELSLSDLIGDLRRNTIEESDLVRLMRWWNKYCRVRVDEIVHSKSLKDSISFYLGSKDGNSSNSARGVMYLKTIEYGLHRTLYEGSVPMPSSVLPESLRDKLTTRLLEERSLGAWFAPLPFRVWAQFISKHSCMTTGAPEDDKVRMLVLKNLSDEFSRNTSESRASLQSWLFQTFSTVRCIPFDSKTPSQYATEFPPELYLSSAHLEIFDGLNTLKKASPYLSRAGISEEFLVAVGVRKTIAMDILFTQLDNLKWNRNPKPLIDYLRAASLTKDDIHKLRTTQYLPEATDKSRTYAPSELYLPDRDLTGLPFIKILQWPVSDALVTGSSEVSFLKMLGCRSEPPLKNLLEFIASDTIEQSLRAHVLDFVSKKLDVGGPYEREYQAIEGVRFMLTKIHDPLGNVEPYTELHAPEDSYYDSSCACMGFPVLEPLGSGKGSRLYGEKFRCPKEPTAESLVHQLLVIISETKEMISKKAMGESNEAAFTKLTLDGFGKIFNYLATRANELDKRMVDTLQKVPFIPYAEDASISWLRPSQVCFKSEEDVSDVTARLFSLVDFNLFLAKVGVRKEPSTVELFRLLLASPASVLDKLGSVVRYCALLRRIAAQPPYVKVSRQIRNTAFLVAYQFDRKSENGKDNEGDEPEDMKYVLAKPTDIFIVDNDFYARRFNVLRAPPESDLEAFYESLGSTYISKSVGKRFKYVGKKFTATSLTLEFADRIRERRPLLVSPNITSRPLVPNAAELLSDEQLRFFEVSQVTALYTFQGVTKTQEITCCSERNSKSNSTLYITQNVEFFDVGSAVGNIILTRCRLEDAFLLGSLLSAPLSQLRAQGFPVDRILRANQPIRPATPPPSDLPTFPEAEGKKVRSPPAKPQSRPEPKSSAPTPPQTPDEAGGFENILRQMYPECSPEHIRNLLGPKPTLETLRQAADTLADGNYPRSQSEIPKAEKRKAEEYNRRQPVKKGGNGNHLFSRAIRGLRGSAASASTGGPSSVTRPSIRTSQQPGISAPGQADSGAPIDDAKSQRGLRNFLQDSVKSSRKVSPHGISAPENTITSVPEEVEKSSANCEVIPGHDLKPAAGPSQGGKTANGILVFTSRRLETSAEFVEENWGMVERFSKVIADLCEVYSLRLTTVAIFHEPSGRTIAFNANKALHFNLRFFASLHDQGGAPPSMECYAYWFATIAHELAHNLVKAHDRQHGYFTESYMSMYLPKLVEFFSRQPVL